VKCMVMEKRETETGKDRKQTMKDKECGNIYI
jgi:hypothetical protein